MHVGGTITHTGNWKLKNCPKDAGLVHGFDTFTGLPEDWGHGYQKALNSVLCAAHSFRVPLADADIQNAPAAEQRTLRSSSCAPGWRTTQTVPMLRFPSTILTSSLRNS